MAFIPASCLGNACRHRALLPSARPLRPPARPQPSGASFAERITSLMASWYHRWPSGSICPSISGKRSSFIAQRGREAARETIDRLPGKGGWPPRSNERKMYGQSRGRNHDFVATARASLYLLENQWTYLRLWHGVFGHPISEGRHWGIWNAALPRDLSVHTYVFLWTSFAFERLTVPLLPDAAGGPP
jgi:hypothetical protein